MSVPVPTILECTLASNVLSTDPFVEGELRTIRKARGNQKAVGKSAGVSASTISRAERGFGVNFTSAILIGVELGLLSYGVFAITDTRIKRILRYMRVVERGGHAKGWNDYCASISEIIRNAA